MFTHTLFAFIIIGINAVHTRAIMREKEATVKKKLQKNVIELITDHTDEGIHVSFEAKKNKSNLNDYRYRIGLIDT